MPSKISKVEKEERFYLVKKPKLNKITGSYEWDSVEIRQSGIKKRGKGLFAKRNLRKNTLIPYGGVVVYDINNLSKKQSTSSYLLDCGDEKTPVWLDANPRLIKNEPEGTWVGCYINEASGKNENYNAELFLLHPNFKQNIPKYPKYDPNHKAFICVKETIKKGDEIFAFYGWSKRHHIRRGYTPKPQKVWDDKVIPKKKVRAPTNDFEVDSKMKKKKIQYLEDYRKRNKQLRQTKIESIRKCNKMRVEN